MRKMSPLSALGLVGVLAVALCAADALRALARPRHQAGDAGARRFATLPPVLARVGGEEITKRDLADSRLLDALPDAEYQAAIFALVEGAVRVRVLLPEARRRRGMPPELDALERFLRDVPVIGTIERSRDATLVEALVGAEIEREVVPEEELRAEHLRASSQAGTPARSFEEARPALLRRVQVRKARPRVQAWMAEAERRAGVEYFVSSPGPAERP